MAGVPAMISVVFRNPAGTRRNPSSEAGVRQILAVTFVCFFPLCTQCFSLSVGVDDVLQYLCLIDLKRLVGKPGSSEFIGTSD